MLKNMYKELIQEMNPDPASRSPEEWLKCLTILYRTDAIYKPHFTVSEMVRFLSPRIDAVKWHQHRTSEFSDIRQWWKELPDQERNKMLLEYDVTLARMH